MFCICHWSYRGRIYTWKHALTNYIKKCCQFLTFFFAALLWVQVPQWSDDWSNCAVDVPDTSCHWYVANADNTFGEGFDWETAPWYSVEGLQDIADLHDDVLADGNTHKYSRVTQKMNLSLQEVDHLLKSLETMSAHDVARAREQIAPGVTDHMNIWYRNLKIIVFV